MDRKFFITFFIAFCISAFLYYFPNAVGFFPYNFGALFTAMLFLGIFLGIAHSLLLAFVVAAFSYLNALLPYLVVVEAHLALFFLALFFVHKDIGKIIDEKIRKKLPGTILHGFGLFILLFALMIVVSLTLFVEGVKPDTGNVHAKIYGLPIYVILFAVLFAPISEELFFRGFLARFGILVSAALFSAAHLLYGSIYEIAGTFVIGVALAYYFKKENNLAACIVAHALFNFASIAIMLVARQLVA